MSDVCIVTSGNDNELIEIEVGLMLSEALKEAGTVLVSQKGKKALLGDGKNDATLVHAANFRRRASPDKRPVRQLCLRLAGGRNSSSPSSSSNSLLLD